MAYPVVASVGTSQELTPTTTHDVVLPSGIASGDLLILFKSLGFSGTPSGPTGWTLLISEVNSPVSARIMYKVADGTESGVTWATAAIRTSTSLCYRITGYQGTPEVAGDLADGNSTANPPSLTPSWGSADTLWFAFFSADVQKASAYPTNYSNNQATYDTGAGNAACGIASRNLTASSDDPGNFTLTGVGNNAVCTVAIQPGLAIHLLPLLGCGA